MTNLRDLVSIEECIEVVRKSHHVSNDEEVADDASTSLRVIDYRLDKLPGQPGFLGEYAHLTVAVEAKDETKELKYFVKCLPFTDPWQRKIVQEYGLFKKEAVTYRELFDKFCQDGARVAKWRPSVWLARDDLMVMEDLVHNGYRPMPFQQPFGKAHVLLILESLAQMHACSLDLEYNQMNGEKLEAKFGHMLFETTFMKESTWFDVGLKGIVKAALEVSKYAKNPSYRMLIESEMLTKMERIYELSTPQHRFQSVIVHKDLWYNNMMFRFEKNQDGTVNYDKPKNCVLLDFQIACYQPPAIDVVSAIYLSTRNPDRRELFDFYVKYYHEQLSEKLRSLKLDVEAVLPWQQFVESVQHYKLFGLVWSGVLHGFVNLPEGFLGDLHVTDPATYHEFCTISRDALMTKFLQTDRYYRETLLDSVDETLEYLFGFE